MRETVPGDNLVSSATSFCVMSASSINLSSLIADTSSSHHRQAFIHEGKYLNYTEMDRRMQSHEAYKALPAKVSQQVLVLLDKNWTAFFEAKAAYEEDPSKFTGRPRLPGYK